MSDPTEPPSQPPTQPIDPTVWAVHTTPLPPRSLDEPVPSEYGRFDALPAQDPELVAKTSSRRTLAVVIAILVLALGGIATVFGLVHASKTADARATIATTQQANAGRGTVVSSHGVSVTLPPGWANLPTSAAELQALAAKAAKTNPQMGDLLTRLASNPDAFKSFAIMANHAGGTSGNEVLTVIAGPASGESASDVLTQTTTQLTAAGATGITQSREEVSGLDAAVLHYSLNINTASGATTIPVALYALFDVDSGAVLTFSNATSLADEKAIVDSLKFG